MEKVIGLECSEDFIKSKAEAAKRQQSAGAANRTKRKKVLDYVNTVAIVLPDLTKEELCAKAIKSYNRRKMEQAFSRGYIDEREDASLNSDWQFLQRICINYLRHSCTLYETELINIWGKVGTQEAYDVLKERINNAIYEKFTYLKY